MIIDQDIWSHNTCYKSFEFNNFIFWNKFFIKLNSNKNRHAQEIYWMKFKEKKILCRIERKEYLLVLKKNVTILFEFENQVKIKLYFIKKITKTFLI